LQPAFRKCCGAILLDTRKVSICPRCGKKVPTTRAITYSADFRIKWADGTETIEDVKGFSTEVFLLKKKLFEYKFPNLTLTVIKSKRGHTTSTGGKT
jgi:hypothetical protein